MASGARRKERRNNRYPYARQEPNATKKDDQSEPVKHIAYPQNKKGKAKEEPSKVVVYCDLDDTV